VYSLTGYGHMVTDKLRTDAYAHALEREIKTGDVVAEIGTGTGIFAFLACRFGARRVYAFEPSAVIELAREMAAANGFADRIEFIPKMSIESALPERVDVIVSDVRGILPFFDRGLLSLIDARQRFLAPNGHMIPRSDTLWIAGVKAQDLYQAHLGPWNDKPYDFEMSAALPRRINSMDPCYLTAEQLFLEPRCLTTIDYQTIQHPDLDASTSWTVDEESQGHGIVLWFDSVLADGITLTNRPGAPRLIYRQQFCPWPVPLDVSPGDTITVKVSARLVGNDYVWRWDTQLAGKNSPQGAQQFRQSTFFGSDFSLNDLRRSASQYQPRLNEEGLIHSRVLALMEGKMSLEAIASQLATDFPKRFPRPQDAFNLVASVSRTFGT
jgi:type I protein arginine methyltransferase